MASNISIDMISLSDSSLELMSKQDMYAIDYGDESDYDLMSTDLLEIIRDRSQSHTNVNRREACYKIRDNITQQQLEWKGALKAMPRFTQGI